jgi:hypothetical protein
VVTKKLLVKMLSLKKQLSFLTPSSLGHCEVTLKLHTLEHMKAYCLLFGKWLWNECFQDGY